jgi:GNAT superfamily N-acetyltransferase
MNMKTEILFAGDGWRARELQQPDVPRLQAFFDANPEYFLTIGGEGPKATTAQEEFDSVPPPEFPFRQSWTLAWEDDDGAMVGMAGIVADLFAPRVWHIGLFVVATVLHGGGAATAMYRQLEQWIRAGGAQWLRLGVVQGNARAERFWARQGYAELRQRHDIPMGLRSNTVRVLMKPLAGGTVDEYLALVGRDRPDAP